LGKLHEIKTCHAAELQKLVIQSRGLKLADARPMADQTGKAVASATFVMLPCKPR
jgi:hypothetical protein